jgi:hypothetical protein
MEIAVRRPHRQNHTEILNASSDVELAGSRFSIAGV